MLLQHLKMTVVQHSWSYEADMSAGQSMHYTQQQTIDVDVIQEGGSVVDHLSF